VNSLMSGRRIPLATMAVLAVGAVGATPAVAKAHSSKSKTLYVTPKGRDRGACTAKNPCKTIAFAIGKAAKGDTVNVAKGTYAGTVTVARDIQVVGSGKPVINAKGHAHGILITGATSRGAQVTGFVVENANDEGILALQTSHVVIASNVVRNNDQGAKASTPTGECAAQGAIPGDCGEGLHLMTVSNSVVRNNTVQNNLGGILLTDELGPTNDNLISSNEALNNIGDCGITLAGHSMKAFANGKTQPAQGGVYGNDITGNTANGNGVRGLGGGILIAAGAPGSAVYGNTVQHNTANGNGLGGFTLHSHSPGQYLNNNKVIDNSFANDAIAGNPGGLPGDVDTGLLKQTAGIIVFSAVTKLAGIVITGNHLANVYYGIWTVNVPTLSTSANTFASSVKVPVFQK
jgi:nitrous oxidase accessory protein NosD